MLVAKAEMLIRKPVAEVFNAFVDPAVTSKFWFSRGSARLEAGKEVRWDWEMYGFSAEAKVKALEPNKRILVEWSAYGAPTDIQLEQLRQRLANFIVACACRGEFEPEKLVQTALRAFATRRAA